MPWHVGLGCCEFRREHTVVYRGDLFLQWRVSLGPPEPDTSILLPLEYYRVRKARDPRDKVYGVLGLSGVKYKQMIQVDYKIDVEVRYVHERVCW